MSEKPALLVTAHGYVHEREDCHPAREHIRRLSGTDSFGEIYAGYASDEPAIETQAQSIGTDRLVVVPLFVSDGHFVGRVVPEHVESACPADVTVEYARPVGTHELMTEVIVRWALAAIDTRSQAVGIALFGHGSERSSNNSDTIREHARRLRNRGLFSEVRSYFVEEPPTGKELPTDFSAESVIAVPVFIADGTHVREDIPQQVGFSGGGGTVDGTEITYVSPVGADPLVAGIVFERAREALDRMNTGCRTDSVQPSNTRKRDTGGPNRTRERRQKQ